MYNGNEFNNKKGSIGLILIQIWTNVYVYFNFIFEEITFKTSTAKTIELSSIIQNEVYETIRKVFNSQKTYSIENSSFFNLALSELGSIIINKDVKIIAIFSFLGVKLNYQKISQDNVLNYLDIVSTTKNDAYFILVTSLDGLQNKLISNPDMINNTEIVDCTFLIEKTKNIQTIEQFLDTEQNGGFGNYNGDSSSIIPDFIITLQSDI